MPQSEIIFSVVESPEGGYEARALLRYGCELTRQTGSHMRLTSKRKGTEHHVTVPAHHRLKIGTLSQILGDVATYLDLAREQFLEELFR